MDHTNSELTELRGQVERMSKRVEELESLIDHMSVPIIPSIIPDTILIPIVGEISPERANMITPKILSHASGAGMDSVIIDLTGIIANDMDALSVLIEFIQKISSSFKLMGIKVFVSGVSRELAQQLAATGLPFVKELNSHMNFKSALAKLMEIKGISFTRIQK